MKNHRCLSLGSVLLALLAGCGSSDTDPVKDTGSAGSQAGAGSAGAGAAGKGTSGKAGGAGKGGHAAAGGVGGAGGDGGAGGGGGAGGDEAAAGYGGSGQIDSPYFARILGDPDGQLASSVASVADGSIWFGGSIKGTLTVDALSLSGENNNDAGRAFLGKLDRQGHALRLEPLGAASQTLLPYRLAPAPDGGVYAMLIELGEVDVGLGAVMGADQLGVVVVRFDPDGKPVWQRLVGADSKKKYPVYSSLVVTADGGVVASAPVQHTVKRFGPAGEVLWEQATPDAFFGAALTISDRVLLAGGASSGDLGPLGAFTAAGEQDGVVLSLDLATGAIVGKQTVGSAGAHTALLATAVEPDGSLLVGGSYFGTFAGLSSVESIGTQALWARLPAGGGEPAWVRSAPLAEDLTDFSFATIPEVMIDAKGGEHLVLVERGTFDAGLGAHTSTDFENVGDVFVLDLGPDGAVVAERFIASGAEDDVGHFELQAQADADGLVLAGSFRVKAGTALGSSEEAGGKEQIYVTRLAP